MKCDYQHYWDHFYDSGYYNPSQRHRFRLILSEISTVLKSIPKPLSSVRVIDLGCGLGHLIHHLKQTYPELHCRGLDISEKVISELRKKMPDSAWDVWDIQKPIDTLSFGHYDIIICSEVLEHCENPEKILDNAYHLTVPGGWIILTVPGGEKYRIDNDLGHLRHYRLEQFKEFFTGKPLAQVRLYTWGWPFSNLMRWMVDKYYGFTKKTFLDTHYTWRQKWFCQLLYCLMFANIHGMGCQLVGIFRKPQPTATG